MLIDGELDAVLGEKSDHPDLKLLFPDTEAEEKSWSAKHHVLPINHMVVVKQQLSDRHPDAVREVHLLRGQPRALRIFCRQRPCFTQPLPKSWIG